MNFRFYLSTSCFYRKDMFDSRESREDAIYLVDGSSYAIKGIITVNLYIHNEAMKKLDEVQYISSFRKNMISHSRLDSSSYR